MSCKSRFSWIQNEKSNKSIKKKIKAKYHISNIVFCAIMKQCCNYIWVPCFTGRDKSSPTILKKKYKYKCSETLENI